MGTIFEQYIDRANGLIERALSGRMIGYTVSAVDTAQRALTFATSETDRGIVAGVIARAQAATYTLHKDVAR